jgi:hypothetical protein
MAIRRCRSCGTCAMNLVVRPARSIFSNVLNFCRPQSRSWSARREVLPVPFAQEGRRYRLRRRAVGSGSCRSRPAIDMASRFGPALGIGC